MFFKILILVLLCIILSSLITAVYFLVTKKKGSRALVKALTVRMGISLVLFVVLMLAYCMGWIYPHGIETVAFLR